MLKSRFFSSRNRFVWSTRWPLLKTVLCFWSNLASSYSLNSFASWTWTPGRIANVSCHPTSFYYQHFVLSSLWTSLKYFRQIYNIQWWWWSGHRPILPGKPWPLLKTTENHSVNQQKKVIMKSSIKNLRFILIWGWNKSNKKPSGLMKKWMPEK